MATEPIAMAEITMRGRLTVAGVADQLLDIHLKDSADALIEAVRCCGEFPECSHVLAWFEEHDQEADRG